jgi:hypothetical protein
MIHCVSPYLLSDVPRFCLVAERRLNLARPFKAGIAKNPIHVASATIESRFSAVAGATNALCAGMIPALKGRAKFMLPLRGQD